MSQNRPKSRKQRRKKAPQTRGSKKSTPTKDGQKVRAIETQDKDVLFYLNLDLTGMGETSEIMPFRVTDTPEGFALELCKKHDLTVEVYQYLMEMIESRYREALRMKVGHQNMVSAKSLSSKKNKENNGLGGNLSNSEVVDDSEDIDQVDRIKILAKGGFGRRHKIADPKHFFEVNRSEEMTDEAVDFDVQDSSLRYYSSYKEEEASEPYYKRVLKAYKSGGKADRKSVKRGKGGRSRGRRAKSRPAGNPKWNNSSLKKKSKFESSQAISGRKTKAGRKRVKKSTKKRPKKNSLFDYTHEDLNLFKSVTNPRSSKKSKKRPKSSYKSSKRSSAADVDWSKAVERTETGKQRDTSSCSEKERSFTAPRPSTSSVDAIKVSNRLYHQGVQAIRMKEYEMAEAKSFSEAMQSSMHSFRPQVNPVSRMIMDNRRDRDIDVSERLMSYGRAVNFKRKQLRYLKDKVQDSKYSYQPKIDQV